MEKESAVTIAAIGNPFLDIISSSDEETLKKYGLKYNRLMMNNVGGSPKDQLESKRNLSHREQGKNETVCGKKGQRIDDMGNGKGLI